MRDKIPDDYFLDTDIEMLEYLETQGANYLDELKSSNDKLRDKAVKIVEILIVGVGASLLLIFNNKQPIYLNISLAVFLASWSVIILFLSYHFVRPIFRMAPYSTPDDLYSGSFKTSKHDGKLIILRQYELHNTTSAIHEYQGINKSLCTNLARAITAIALAPLTFLITLVISYCLS